MGVPWGAPDDLNTFMAMVNNYQIMGVFCLFARRHKCLMLRLGTGGGNVRVGLEDNLYLERGVLATNAQLVDKAASIQKMGAEVMSPQEVRDELE